MEFAYFTYLPIYTASRPKRKNLHILCCKDCECRIIHKLLGNSTSSVRMIFTEDEITRCHALLFSNYLDLYDVI
jgi:hypothetical protein